ncbi:hypothetical protein [Streptacidiphilus fuscans]|uniref:FtsK domain-containing protein n=1 Tax=Streptacidiphilus fuscans TaxID=2789292 RepID=A0A931B945_9ACTN|nr:hypothetical protein [Streptacidiphilus fuscans]MBF9068940.1 hypothetical protein [Streptacidiphilus fuscans]MBF9073394.1 hypothetical protein [Streptacidiphilus fuscans]
MTFTEHLTRGRDLARTASDHAADMFGPLITIGRGLRAHAQWTKNWWANTPKDKRGPALFLVVAVVAAVALLPYGPLLALLALMGSAAWAGRSRTEPAPPAPDTSQLKLAAVYTALTPYLVHESDPSPLYAHGGDFKDAFTGWEFDEEGRLTSLDLRYPAYFTDTEPHSRARIEQVIHGKVGRSREYRFTWDQEVNRLQVSALPPLPGDIAAQTFVTAAGELVLGFTDTTSTNRMIPVRQAGGQAHQPPVLWRTGPRSAEPHLLALGAHGYGTSTLLRSLALQALQYGDIAVIDGAGTGEHACLVGRPGVHTVETSLHGALAALEWAANETQRRLDAHNLAKRSGGVPPADTLRPLWLLLDHPSELTELAQAEGRTDPQELLEVPLRHGRTAHVTVVVVDRLEALDRIRPGVRTACRARVVLGPIGQETALEALGAPLDITPSSHTPPGRGYARLGNSAPIRLQVPATPDPLDEDAPTDQRDAVIALLPHADTRTETTTELNLGTDLLGKDLLSKDRSNSHSRDMAPVDLPPVELPPDLPPMPTLPPLPTEAPRFS